MGLRWMDILWDSDTVLIQGQSAKCPETGKNYWKPQTKSREPRILTLTETLKEVLLEIKARQELYGMKDCPYVCQIPPEYRRYGQFNRKTKEQKLRIPIISEVLAYELKPITKELGIKGTPHCARHSYAYHFIKSQTKDPEVSLFDMLNSLQRILGHSHLSATERYIVTTDEDRKKSVISASSERKKELEELKKRIEEEAEEAKKKKKSKKK